MLKGNFVIQQINKKPAPAKPERELKTA